MSRVDPTASRGAQLRDAILTLSRVLASGQQGGVLSESLEILLEGLGCARGAAYSFSGGTLELVAHRGVPPNLRPLIARIERGEDGARAGFAVERAARTRRVQVDPDLAATTGFPRDVLDKSGWKTALAAPVALGREVLAVIVFGHPTPELFGRDALAFAETAGHLIALALSRQQRAADAPPPREPTPVTKESELGVVGWLALGVAEELAEPLTSLGTQLAEVESRLHASRAASGLGREVEVVQILLSESRAAVARATRIRERFVSLARDSAVEATSLGDVARDAVALVTPSFGARGVMLVLRDKGAAFVQARRALLLQLLAQLLLRAECEAAVSGASPAEVELTVDADAGRGTLTIEHPSAPAGEDRPVPSGLGVAANVADAVAYARKAVALQRGSFEMGFNRAGAALLRVALPLAAAPPKSRAPSRAVPTPPPATPDASSPTGLTILWIDDDPLFLRSVKRLLRGSAFVVARTAAEALQILDRVSNPNLVFCDLALPDMAGEQLHKQLLASRPLVAQRFVFVTGGGLTPEIADYLVSSGCPTLLKPVRAEDLDALLQRALAAQSLAPTPRLRKSRRPRASTPVVPKPTLPPSRATVSMRRQNAAATSTSSSSVPAEKPARPATGPRHEDGPAPATRRSAATRRRVTAPATPVANARESELPAPRRKKDD
ncbi:MAG TPA: GAF domain-containing protein [Byssovorax sp.]|jgi:CheY-like chemotaxis protein